MRETEKGKKKFCPHLDPWRERGFKEEGMIDKRKNPKTERIEYCLVSVSSGKVLEWYGPKKPNEEKVKESEARVNWFKHKG